MLLTGLRIGKFNKVGLGKTLVIGVLSLPVVIYVIIGSLSMVLAVALTILTVLEGECP